MSVRIVSCSHIAGIFHIFIFGYIFLTGGGIQLFMFEACLDLHHCAAEASPCSALLLLGHEALVYSVLISPILFIFKIRNIS